MASCHEIKIVVMDHPAAPNHETRATGTLSVQQAFCERFRCAEAKFAQRAMWRAIPPHVRPFARLMYFFDREYFKPDLDLVRRTGEATTMEEVRSALRDFHHDNVYSHPFLRQQMRVRVSTKRLLRLAARLLSNRPARPRLRHESLVTAHPAP